MQSLAELLEKNLSEQKWTEAMYLTKTGTSGMHLYRSADEDSSVFFVDENRGIRKMIIDSYGNIQNFPGIIKEEFWVKHVAPNYLKQQVRFYSKFEKRDNGWIFLWQVQPDGWYWADEHWFGAEDDWTVVLYTYVDLNGDFTSPFRIYQLDTRGYSMDRFQGKHAQSQKWAMEATWDVKKFFDFPDDILPQLWGCKAVREREKFYQLKDKNEAQTYWNDPILSQNLKKLSQAMLESPKSLCEIMGMDSHRLKGSMTLFYLISEEPLFKQVLDKYCDGKLDEFTVKRLNEGE